MMRYVLTPRQPRIGASPWNTPHAGPIGRRENIAAPMSQSRSLARHSEEADAEATPVINRGRRKCDDVPPFHPAARHPN
jgi:hypothetical protein